MDIVQICESYTVAYSLLEKRVQNASHCHCLEK
jgi:hypothetical protein